MRIKAFSIFTRLCNQSINQSINPSKNQSILPEVITFLQPALWHNSTQCSLVQVVWRCQMYHGSLAQNPVVDCPRRTSLGQRASGVVFQGRVNEPLITLVSGYSHKDLVWIHAFLFKLSGNTDCTHLIMCQLVSLVWKTKSAQRLLWSDGPTFRLVLVGDGGTGRYTFRRCDRQLGTRHFCKACHRNKKVCLC